MALIEPTLMKSRCELKQPITNNLKTICTRLFIYFPDLSQQITRHGGMGAIFVLFVIQGRGGSGSLRGCERPGFSFRHQL